ncbi:MAG: MBOAT family O-acyltransferase [Bacillota bacterium]
MIFLFLFLPFSFLLYFASSNQTYRNWVLILLSLLFYAWGEPVWISVLIVSATVDYFHGLIVERYRGRWQSKAAVLSSLAVNLSLLGFFKYWAFFAENLGLLLGTQIPAGTFNLPIGISFYTFQTISYVIDVYRGEVEAQRSFPKLLLFVSLFHQLVAGPIVRYKDIAREIEHRVITLPLFSTGVSRFVCGLGKKVIFANTAGEVAEIFLNGRIDQLPVLGAWFGITMFAFQIYFDFSGYSDMAIGLGKMFGFTYKENFNYPYTATSATDFWRRWHMSLGSFFRDYVYIPLGGNQTHHSRNLFVVWFLTGLWHGASWNFVVWGLYYGLLIMIEKLVLFPLMKRLPAVLSHIYLLAAMLVGWVFFYYTDLSQAMKLLAVMFGLTGQPLTDTELVIHLTNNFAFLVLAAIASTPLVSHLFRRLTAWATENRLQPVVMQYAWSAWNFVTFAVSTALLVGKSYNPFLYFRF